MPMKQIITIGIALAIAVLGSVTQALIALPLWVIAVLLFGWGLQPKAMEELVGRLPYVGSYILKAFAKLDSILARWS
jgi:hypothetical protein